MKHLNQRKLRKKSQSMMRKHKNLLGMQKQPGKHILMLKGNLETLKGRLNSCKNLLKKITGRTMSSQCLVVNVFHSLITSTLTRCVPSIIAVREANTEDQRQGWVVGGPGLGQMMTSTQV